MENQALINRNDPVHVELLYVVFVLRRIVVVGGVLLLMMIFWGCRLFFFVFLGLFHGLCRGELGLLDVECDLFDLSRRRGFPLV